MVRIEVSGDKECEYHFHGGGHDGSRIRCGPGLPWEPPRAIVIEDDEFTWRYEYTLSISDDEETPGGYALAAEIRK